MSFRITGLSPEPFRSLFGLPDEELAMRGVKRCVVDKNPGFPDRIEMRDAAVGETVLLLNHTCQPADTPYRATHAIFVREGAAKTYDAVDQVPDQLRRRILAARGYDGDGMLVNADLVDGRELEGKIEQLFAEPRIAYLQLHFAKPGCYAARVERA